MQCSYCLSEMPNEAKACAACGRMQPAARGAMAWWIAVIAIAVLAGGAGIYLVSDASAETNAIKSTVLCIRMQGGIADEVSVRNQVESAGAGWRETVNTLRSAHGCPPL